jgi:hypothetical protein
LSQFYSLDGKFIARLLRQTFNLIAAVEQGVADSRALARIDSLCVLSLSATTECLSEAYCAFRFGAILSLPADISRALFGHLLIKQGLLIGLQQYSLHVSRTNVYYIRATGF